MQRRGYLKLTAALMMVLMLIPAVSFAADGSSFPQIIVNPVQTRDNGIKIDMFDYGSPSGAMDLQNREINSGASGRHQLLFNPGSATDGANQWTGPGGPPRTGIVKDTLGKDGYPVMNRINGESLSYLFDPARVKGRAYEDLDGLFMQDRDGAYIFDSSENFASLADPQTGKVDDDVKMFHLYEKPNVLNFTASDPGAHFIPFNSFTSRPETAESPLSTDSAEAGQVNWYFGMNVEADFIMPADGKIKTASGGLQDMIFEFRGDDDVWVFIDDRLVLDLGGIHDRVGGSINFSTGTVSQSSNYIGERVESEQTNLWELFGSRFKKGSSHNIKFFYLERGATASNCKIKFNLPVLPAESLTIGKEVSKLPQTDYPEGITDHVRNIDYTFKVLKAGEDGSPAEPEQSFIEPGTEYQLWKGGTDTGKKGRTGSDGTIKLKHDEVAVFPGLLKTESGKFFVREEMLPAAGGQYGNLIYHIANSEGIAVQGDRTDTDFTYETGVFDSTEQANIMFRNQFDAATVSRLKIKKDIDSGSALIDREAPFDVDIKLNGTGIPDGMEFDVADSANGDSVRASAGGSVRIYDGETLTMKTGLLTGTDFEVREKTGNVLFSPEYTGSVTYSRPGSTAKTVYLQGSSSGMSGTADDIYGEAVINIKNSDRKDIADTVLNVSKKIKGREWKASDSFRFRLETADAETAEAAEKGIIRMPSDAAGVTVENDTPQHKTAFGKIIFTEAGTYRFSISEIIPESAEDGLSYDRTEKMVTVNVEENGETLSASADTSEAVFTNTFIPEPVYLDGSSSLKVVKSMEGRDLRESDSFTFELTADEGTPMPGQTSLTLKGNDIDSDGNITGHFGDIRYDKAGEYSYTVTEKGGDSDGIVFSDSSYKVEVSVRNDGSGVLRATSSMKRIRDDKGQTVNETADTAVFTNSYHADPYTLSGDTYLKISKTLKGRDWRESDSFSFRIDQIDENGRPVEDDRNVRFTEKHLTLSGSDAGKTEGSGTDTSTEASGSFGGIELKAKGTYRFLIKEVIPEDKADGMTYDTGSTVVTAAVSDNGNGKLTAAVTYEGSMEFVNTYEPELMIGTDTEAGIRAEKKLEGRELRDGEFTFTLTPAEGQGDIPMPAVTEVSNDTGGDIVFGPVRYTEEGTYRYTIKENDCRSTVIKDSRAVEVEVDVSYSSVTGKLSADSISYTMDGRSGNTFINRYRPEAADAFTGVSLKKTLVPVKGGESMKVSAGDFSFLLTPSPCNENDPLKAPAVVKTDAQGTAEFLEGLVYTAEGKYEYTVAEIQSGDSDSIIYDSSVYKITVDVKDEGEKLKASSRIECDGRTADSITYENGYSIGNTSALIRGTKVIDGDRQIGDGEFMFRIDRITDGAPMPDGQTVSNTGSTFVFGPIVFEEPGDYVYKISEVDRNAAGFTYDKSSHEVKVSVKETTYEGSDQKRLTNEVSGADDITFTNRYEPLPLELKGQSGITVYKELAGRDLRDSEFDFELRDSSGKLLKTAQNDKEGRVSFEGIVIDEAGTYDYTVSEVKGSLGGVTCDDSVYGVRIIAEDRDGQLEAVSVRYLDGKDEVDRAVFRNSYKAEGTAEVTPGAVKALKGRALKDGEFSFELRAENGDVLETVRNTSEGTVDFSTLSFDREGIYKYTVRELRGSDSDIIYDDSVFELTVRITDDLQGHFVSEIEKITKNGEETDSIRFINILRAGSDPGAAPGGGNGGGGTETGDRSNMGIFVISMITAAAAAAAAAGLRRRYR